MFHLSASWAEVSDHGNWRESPAWEATYDRYVEDADRHGITMLADLYGNREQFYLSSEWAEWREFVWTFVQRYGRGGSFWAAHPSLPYRPITVWEVWNEPNFKIHNPGGETVQPRNYAEFFDATATTITNAQNAIRKIGEPEDTRVLIGGLNLEVGAMNVWEFFEAIAQNANLDREFKEHYNGLSIHPYSIEHATYEAKWTGVITEVTEARNALDQYASEAKTLWITELGWPIEGTGKTYHVTESEQSELLTKTFGILKGDVESLNLKYLTWYNYRDLYPAGEGSWDYHCGLRMQNGLFRPSWYAYQTQSGAARWPIPPGAETLAPTGIQARQATLNGNIDPEGLGTNFRFEYDVTPYSPGEGPHGTSIPIPNASAGWEGRNFSESATPSVLTPNTTYHYRIVATNENAETSYGGDVTVNTLPAPPIVTTEGSSNIRVESEKGKVNLKGSINPNGFETVYHFEWGTQREFEEGKYSHSTTGTLEYKGYTEAKPVEQTIEGISGSGTYHYRLVAESSEGKAIGADKSFSTPDWSPSVAIKGFELVSPHIYKVHAKINPKGFPTHYGFEYDTTEYKVGEAPHGTVVEATSTITGSTEQEVSMTLEGLAFEQVYYYRAFASNEGDGTKTTNRAGNERIRTPSKPAITSQEVLYTNSFEPQLRATINPERADTHYQFEYGETTGYGSKIPATAEDIGSGEKVVAVVATLKGLRHSAPLHFRVVAENEVGVSQGADKSFTTLAPCKNGTETCQWSLQGAREAGGAASATGVFCSSGRPCVDVGQNSQGSFTRTQLEEWGVGLSFAGVSSARISCIVTMEECLVVGAVTGGLRSWLIWNDELVQREETLPLPAGAREISLRGLSCGGTTSAFSCMAVGSYFDEAKIALLPLAELWKGEGWSQLSVPPVLEESPTKSMQAVFCASNVYCKTVGLIGTTGLLAETWNGSSWSHEQSLILLPYAKEAQLEGLSCPSTSACMAVGHFRNSETNKDEGAAEQWVNGSWSPVIASLPPEAEGGYDFYGVSCLAPGSCFAVGKRKLTTSLSSEVRPLTEFWNGSGLSAQITPNPVGHPTSLFNAISCISSIHCTAVGSSSPLSGGSGPLVEGYE